MSVPAGQAAISATGLTKRYDQREAVADIDLHVMQGEIFGLLGPNGAGKTTCIEMIAGLRQASEGAVRVLGLDPAEHRAQLTELLSVQPQTAQLFPTLTVTETLELFASFYANPRSVTDVIALVGLEDSRRVRVKQLSGGQARRLLIGVAVIGRTSVVVLDEPSAGLDPAARRLLWTLIRALRDEGVTVLLTTHHMDEAMELCDHIAIMVSGSIVATGTPDQLIAAHSAASRVRFLVPPTTDHAVISEVTGDLEVRFSQADNALLVEVDTPDPDTLLRRITFKRGLSASGIRVTAASLEDVFLQLAGEAGGDWAAATQES